jgi:16S rRNA (guanine966-N2)-methyltransferase
MVGTGGFVRIIAGSAKGRNLKSPKGMLTRPTQDRTRESLFNVLENYGFLGSQVLDVFAGTGALGLEALSRGAEHCVFIDHYTRQLIVENAALCGFTSQCEVLKMEVERALQRLQGRSFHYIFADPPYNKNLINDTIRLIFQYGLLRPQGLILMEHSPKEMISTDGPYHIFRTKRYGKDTCISFIRGRQEGET